MLTASGSANRIDYRANQGNPTFSELRGLLAKTSGLAWALKEALSALTFERLLREQRVVREPTNRDEIEELLHEAPEFEIAVECWLAERHPELGGP